MVLHDKDCVIDNIKYHYTMQGQGETVVLLHGFTGSSATWKPFIGTWKNNYQVITVDLPGHGKTMGDASLTMEQVCRHLAILFDYLTIEKCHLIGYSMGGRTALSFSMWYPEYIRSLLLESASPGLRTETERKSRIEQDKQLAARIRREGITAFVDFWESLPLFNTQKRLPRSVRHTIRNERLQQTKEGLATSLLFLGTGNQPSWWDDLGSLSMRVCLIVGAEDEKFVDINKQMNQQLLHSVFHVVPNAGHAVHIEQPGPFQQIVQSFMQENNK